MENLEGPNPSAAGHNLFFEKAEEGFLSTRAFIINFIGSWSNKVVGDEGTP